MANVDQAIDFVLSQEDSKMSGHVTTLKGDSGGATRFGIASKYHPELIEEGYFDENKVGRVAALVTAEHIYTHDYANPLLLWQIKDQKLANAVLSFAINAGVRTAAKMLQHAVDAFPDGMIGQATLHAVNTGDPVNFLAEFSELARQHYQQIVANNSSQLRFLNGWLNRVNAWTA